MFHHVPGQLVLGTYRHLDNLVEVVGRDIERIQHPGEGALRVVRVDHNLQAAGEQRLVEHLMTQQALHSYSFFIENQIKCLAGRRLKEHFAGNKCFE